MAKASRRIIKGGKQPKWSPPPPFGPKQSRQRIRGEVFNVKR